MEDDDDVEDCAEKCGPWGPAWTAIAACAQLGCGDEC
jgi:hypothetical protein